MPELPNDRTVTRDKTLPMPTGTPSWCCFNNALFLAAAAAAAAMSDNAFGSVTCGTLLARLESFAAVAAAADPAVVAGGLWIEKPILIGGNAKEPSQSVDSTKTSDTWWFEPTSIMPALLEYAR